MFFLIWSSQSLDVAILPSGLRTGLSDRLGSVPSLSSLCFVARGRRCLRPQLAQSMFFYFYFKCTSRAGSGACDAGCSPCALTTAPLPPRCSHHPINESNTAVTADVIAKRLHRCYDNKKSRLPQSFAGPFLGMSWNVPKLCITVRDCNPLALVASEVKGAFFQIPVITTHLSNHTDNRW